MPVRPQISLQWASNLFFEGQSMTARSVRAVGKERNVLRWVGH